MILCWMIAPVNRLDKLEDLKKRFGAARYIDVVGVTMVLDKMWITASKHSKVGCMKRNSWKSVRSLGSKLSKLKHRQKR